MIGSAAFEDCSSLTGLEIPDSVSIIRWAAFRGCSSLTSIEIPHSVTEIREYTFDGCPIKCYSVDKHNPDYTSDDGILFDKAKKTIIKYPAGKESNSYQIPAGVINLNFFAFEGAVNLHEVFMPSTIRCICFAAFANCTKLTKLHLRVEDPNLFFIIDDNVFKDFALDQCTLYVPIGTGYAYRHHPVFGKFKEVIIER